MSGLLRYYSPDTDPFTQDGYPLAWREIKHLIREQAGHRCIRCFHPYLVRREGNVESTPGHQRMSVDGKWVQVSRCDNGCRHGGPVMYWSPTTGWGEYDGPDETIATEVYALWRILTVHHLDGDKANCRWWNLTALCQRCHLTIQGKVQMDRPYDKPHTAWFQPYAAGFYAFKYLDLDLTRAEVEQRMEELLLLELRQERLFAL